MLLTYYKKKLENTQNFQMFVNSLKKNFKSLKTVSRLEIAIIKYIR